MLRKLQCPRNGLAFVVRTSARCSAIMTWGTGGGAGDHWPFLLLLNTPLVTNNQMHTDPSVRLLCKC